MTQATIPTHTKNPPPGRMTFDEYMEWAGEDTNAEWVDGEVVWVSPNSLDSGDIGQFLGALLRLYVEHHNLGYVFSERVLMRLATRPSGREPDVVFVAEERSAILKKTYIDGPADLAIEVVGPESRTRDRVDKFNEYAQAGVREYWIVDSDEGLFEFYQLNDDRRYELVPADDYGVYHSSVISGLWLRVDWLRQRPLPKLLSVLTEWKII